MLHLSWTLTAGLTSKDSITNGWLVRFCPFERSSTTHQQIPVPFRTVLRRIMRIFLAVIPLIMLLLPVTLLMTSMDPISFVITDTKCYVSTADLFDIEPMHARCQARVNLPGPSSSNGKTTSLSPSSPIS